MVVETERSSLELLYHVSRELADTLDLRTVLQRVVYLSMRTVGAISGSIIVLDETGQPIDSAFLYEGRSRDPAKVQLNVTYEHGLAGWVARHCQAVLIPDTSRDERWLRRPDDDRSQTGPKSAVSAPILAQGDLVGVMTLVHPQPGFFNLDHLALVQAISDQAGAAIQRARLFDRSETTHRRYWELFQESIEPILITDPNGLILEANRQVETTIGVESQALRSRSIEELHFVDLNVVGLNFKHLTSGKTISYESSLSGCGECDVPVQVYVRKVDIAGKAYLQWILRDITETKKLDSLREDLLSMIYHDLRSPLANVISSLDVLESILPKDSNPAISSLLDIAIRSTERVQNLTNSLLDINRLEAGQTVVNRQYIPPSTIVDYAVDMASTPARTKNVELSVEDCLDLPEIFADRDMIQRVLVNLIENAIKFSPQGSKVTIGANHAGKVVGLWVRDEGPGIPLAERERIFEKFTRLNAKDGLRGLGLGLAFCRLAVNAHGGRIWVESEPGRGSIFTFTIPTKEQHLVN